MMPNAGGKALLNGADTIGDVGLPVPGGPSDPLVNNCAVRPSENYCFWVDFGSDDEKEVSKEVSTAKFQSWKADLLQGCHFRLGGE